METTTEPATEPVTTQPPRSRMQSGVAAAKSTAKNPWAGVALALIGLGTAYINWQKEKAQVVQHQEVTAKQAFDNSKDLLGEQGRIKDALLAAMSELASTNQRLASLEQSCQAKPAMAQQADQVQAVRVASAMPRPHLTHLPPIEAASQPQVAAVAPPVEAPKPVAVAMPAMPNDKMREVQLKIKALQERNVQLRSPVAF